MKNPPYLFIFLIFSSLLALSLSQQPENSTCSIPRVLATSDKCNDFCDECVEGVCKECKGANRNLPDCTCQDEFFYPKSSKKDDCVACHYSCKTCDGRSENDCIDCAVGWAKDEDGLCQCAPGYFGEGITCKKCLSNHCNKCDQYGICEQCGVGAQLVGGSCHCNYPFVDNKDENTHQCVCRDGFFSTTPGKCEKCSKGCHHCLNTTWCDYCQDTYQLAPIEETGTQKCICSFGRYWHSACHQSCASCKSSDPYGCLSCLSTEMNYTNGKCECPKGEYIDIIKRECKKCHPTCAKCVGPEADDCTVCEPPKEVSPFGTCGCKAGFYFDEAENACIACVENCFFCKDKTGCELCNYGYKYHKKKDKCICGGGFFLSTQMNNTCQSCHPSCEECKGPFPEDCTACPENSGKVELEQDEDAGDDGDTSDGTQKKFKTFKCECNDGWYNTLIKRYAIKYHSKNPLEVPFSSCKACHQSCKTCKSGMGCEECGPGLVQDPYSKNCYCPPGSTIAEGETFGCVPCDATCATCSISPTTCTSCTDLEISPAGGKCLCKDGFYYNLTTDSCLECHDDCMTCTGPNETDCVYCKNIQLEIHPQAKVCICPAGKYMDVRYDFCRECHVSCMTCTAFGPEACTSCRAGILQVEDAEEGSGICRCGPRKYEIGDGICGECDENCEYCFGPTGNECLSCSNEQFEVLEDGSCGCPPRTAMVGTICIDCHTGCKRCDGDACLACDEGFDLENGLCKCPSGYYLNRRFESCSVCDASCRECDQLATNCTACSNEKTFDNNSCLCHPDHKLDEASGVCVEQASAGTYLDPATDRYKPCIDYCIVCEAENFPECTQCVKDFSLLNGTCVDVCPPGHFIDTVHSQPKCQLCPNDCIDCDDAAHCRRCSRGFELDFLKRCVPIFACEKGFFFNFVSQGCQKCNPKCRDCNGPESYHCLECNPKKALHEGSCHFCRDVPDVTYDAENGVCVGVCGDGKRKGYNEECDDGNTIDGDGCSSNCTVEPGFRCSGLTPDVCEVTGGIEAYLIYDENDYRKLTVKFTRPVATENFCDLVLKFEKLSDNDFVYDVTPDPKTFSCKVRIEILRPEQADTLLVRFKNPDKIRDKFGLALGSKSWISEARYTGYMIREKTFEGFAQNFGDALKYLVFLTLIISYPTMTSRYAYTFWRFVEMGQTINLFQFSGLNFPNNVRYMLKNLNIMNLISEDNSTEYHSFDLLNSISTVLYGFLVIEFVDASWKIRISTTTASKAAGNRRFTVMGKITFAWILVSFFDILKFLHAVCLSSLSLQSSFESIINYIVAAVLGFMILKHLGESFGYMFGSDYPDEHYFVELKSDRKGNVYFEIGMFIKRAILILIIVSETMPPSRKFNLVFFIQLLFAVTLLLKRPYRRTTAIIFTFLKEGTIAVLGYQISDYAAMPITQQIEESWKIAWTILIGFFIQNFSIIWDLVSIYITGSALIVKVKKDEISRDTKLEEVEDASEILAEISKYREKQNEDQAKEIKARKEIQEREKRRQIRKGEYAGDDDIELRETGVVGEPEDDKSFKRRTVY